MREPNKRWTCTTVCQMRRRQVQEQERSRIVWTSFWWRPKCFLTFFRVGGKSVVLLTKSPFEIELLPLFIPFRYLYNHTELPDSWFLTHWLSTSFLFETQGKNLYVLFSHINHAVQSIRSRRRVQQRSYSCNPFATTVDSGKEVASWEWGVSWCFLFTNFDEFWEACSSTFWLFPVFFELGRNTELTEYPETTSVGMNLSANPFNTADEFCNDVAQASARSHLDLDFCIFATKRAKRNSKQDKR